MDGEEGKNVKGECHSEGKDSRGRPRRERKPGEEREEREREREKKIKSRPFAFHASEGSKEDKEQSGLGSPVLSSN